MTSCQMNHFNKATYDLKSDSGCVAIEGLWVQVLRFSNFFIFLTNSKNHPFSPIRDNWTFNASIDYVCIIGNLMQYT